MKIAVAGSAQSRKDSTLGELLNVECKECTQVPLKESEWKSSGGTRPLKLSEGCADNFRAKKPSRKEEESMVSIRRGDRRNPVSR
jgi:hypothetical protein